METHTTDFDVDLEICTAGFWSLRHPTPDPCKVFTA